MSQSNALAVEFKFYLAEESCYFAAAALFCYDYCLTLDREVRYFWGARVTPAAFLFYSIRYTALFNTIFVVMEGAGAWSGHSDKSCTILERLDMAFNVVLLSSAAAFSAMRVYGMFEYRKLLFAFTLCTGLVNPAISLYIYVSSVPDNEPAPFNTCGLRSSIDARTYNAWMMGGRASSMLSDALILLLTWLKVGRTLPGKITLAQGRRTISEVLLKDNVVYFGILLIINLVGLAVGHQFELVYSVTTWIAILTAILIPRFMLDLREVGTPAGPATMADTELVTVRTMMFVERAHILDSIPAYVTDVESQFQQKMY